MARQLYDYWFVQFDFPDENGKPYKSSGGKMVWNEQLKREIPSGWKASTLSSIEPNIVTGKTPSTSISDNFGFEIPFVTIDDIRKSLFVYESERYLSSKGADSQRNKYLPAGSLCCSCIGTVGILGFTGKTCQTNQQINSIVFGEIIHKEYVYFSLRQHFRYSTAKTGNILPNMNKEEFCSIPILQPNNTIVVAFHRATESLFKEIDCNTMSSLNLRRELDLLLPLLMNGQVSVKPLNNHFVERKRMLSSTFPKTRCMKDELIQRIVEEMDGFLCEEQVRRLRNAIHVVLDGYSIDRVMTDKEQLREDNEQLLNAFLSAKKVEGCSEKTLDYYRATLAKMLAETEKRIPEISTNDVRQYLSDFKEMRGSSKVTIDNIRRIFSSFFSWLEDEDYITKNPVRRIHRVRADSLVKEIISDESMEILRDSCTEMRDLAMIDLLASTGMRVGELVRMNIADIDFQERQCVVFGKGNKERTVYFNARTKIHLSNYIVSRKDSNPALFVSLSEPFNRLSISGVEKRLRFIGSQVNIARVHPHKFRRTLATTAIDRGMPIEQVQKLLGHVKIDTTLHYAMVGQNNVKNSHRKFIC